MSRYKVLRKNTSGYFLIAQSSPLAPGWRLASTVEASAIRSTAPQLAPASQTSSKGSGVPNTFRVTPPLHPALFAVKLVRTSATTAAEDHALSEALAAYAQRTAPDNFDSLTDFLNKYPKSGWAPALLTNIGLSYFNEGYFSLAMANWKQAFELGKNSTDPYGRALVDSAIGDLASAYSDFGQIDKLKALVAEIKGRPISGPAGEMIENAEDDIAILHDECRNPPIQPERQRARQHGRQQQPGHTRGQSRKKHPVPLRVLLPDRADHAAELLPRAVRLVRRVLQFLHRLAQQPLPRPGDG